MVFSLPSFSDWPVEGRDLGRGGGEAVRGAGDKERLEDCPSRVGEAGVEVGNGVVPFNPGGGELGGA